MAKEQRQWLLPLRTKFLKVQIKENEKIRFKRMQINCSLAPSSRSLHQAHKTRARKKVSCFFQMYFQPNQKKNLPSSDQAFDGGYPGKGT